MTKKILFVLIGLFLLCALIYSAENAAEKKGAGTETTGLETEKGKNNNSVLFFAIVGCATVIGLGIASAGGGIGMGIATSKAVEGVARQPEATSKIQTLLIIGLAFIESVVIYVLVIALILLYADPFIGYVIK
jgi:F-type H+-transporting ATPase subunit c